MSSLNTFFFAPVMLSRWVEILAEELGLDKAVGLLEQTLEEENMTDETLTKIAVSVVNQEAA